MATEGTQTQGSTGDTGAGAGEAKWYDSLPDDLKGNETLQGYDGIESLAKAHLTVHGENATLKKQIEDSKTVVPDKPEGYELPAKFEGMPDEAAKEISAEVARVAHEAGLSKEQAAKIFNAVMAGEKKELEELTAQMAREKEETINGLKKDFGDQYEAKLNNAFLRCSQIAGKINIAPEAFKDFLNKTGIGDNPTFIRFAISLADLISPDVFEQNRTTGPEKSAAEVLYPNQGKK